MLIDVSGLDHRAVNERLRQTPGDIELTGCLGQRFIAAGFSEKKIRIEGVPGNALGAYLNGAEITVMGNAQDAVGDTMNNGKIIVHGDIGDAAGYAMRGGVLYIQGSAGYRTGIHMKEYRDKKPVIVIGGKCGSFLGEYQAGGLIIVLGLADNDRRIVSNFPCTGMHGGKVFIRAKADQLSLPEGVTASTASSEDLQEIREYVDEFGRLFGFDPEEILNAPFTKIEPASHNPYQQMYAAN